MLKTAALIAEHLGISKKAFQTLVTRYRDTEKMPIKYIKKGPGQTHIAAEPEAITQWFKQHIKLASERQGKAIK